MEREGGLQEADDTSEDESLVRGWRSYFIYYLFMCLIFPVLVVYL